LKQKVSYFTEKLGKTPLKHYLIRTRGGVLFTREVLLNLNSIQ
jgi:hypothetical protein